MVAVSIGQTAYITKAPPWSKKMFKMGRLAYAPGELPPALKGYLLAKGEVAPIVSDCVAKGKRGPSLVRCINTGVAIKKSKGIKRTKY